MVEGIFVILAWSVIVVAGCSDVIKVKNPQNCSENEVLTTCVDPCLPTCAEPLEKICHFLVCNEGCVCKDGSIRSKIGGPCIDAKQCGEYCRENQEYSPCGSACPKTCGSKNDVCADVCVAGCHCKKGYILDNLGGECIAEEKCPQLE